LFSHNSGKKTVSAEFALMSYSIYNTLMTHHMNNTPTPHNAANAGDIAPFVLFPGDPLRAQYIAEHFLSDAKQVTGVRGMLGFTGTYNGKRVTAMGSGMGSPSAGIYSYELFHFYEVEKIVRIGTAGGFAETVEPGDLIFAQSACTDSNYAYQYELPGTFSPCADFTLLRGAAEFAEKNNIRYHSGMIFSSDMFSSYNALSEKDEGRSWKPWARVGCLGQDMETYALYCNASFLGKKALSIVTMVASCSTGKMMTNHGMDSLEPMMKTALSLA
jgi:purine-nucleoside phosphorylase